jgi:putative endopeptidase
MPNFTIRLLAASALLALSAAAARAETATPQPGPSPATGEWGSFGVQTQYIDSNARPGDDFDRYVNGKWNDAAQLPADKVRISNASDLTDLSEARLREILESLPRRQWPAGSPEARIARLYGAFMDVAGIEARGLAPARPWLDKIAAVKSRDDLLALFAAPGMPSPLEIGISADAKDSGRYAVYYAQGGLGLPDRDYYLVDSPRNLGIRAKYTELLVFLLGKAGHADPAAAAASVLALETQLARASWDRTLGRNRDLTYNKLTLDQLGQMPSGATARSLLEKFGAGAAAAVIVPHLPPSEERRAAAKLTAAQAEKISGGLPAAAKLIEDAPIAAWQAWMTTRFLSDNAAVLPQDIDAANFAFYGTVLSGQAQQRPRWKRGISAVQNQIGELLGQIYARRYFPAANRRAMQQLVGNLRSAMAANLAELQWMGPETRLEAQAKLSAFTTKIGAPMRFKRYEGLAISPSDPLANGIEAIRWGTDFQLARIGKPVDRDEWFILPQTVNAYYFPPYNEIVFPAAFLQPPMFNPSADPAVNYGAIGAVIGHELGHGFDDQGSKVDGAGNQRDWWKPQDRAAFEALTAKLVEQYSAFCPFDEGKTCLNGKLTLGENIGDIGGLSMALRAYQMSLRGKPAPVLGGFTGEQRFFLAYAQLWRAKSREASLRQRLVTGPHSLEKYRVNGVVRNFDAWYKAFDVKPGDKLYLPPEQRVRIW